VAWSQLFVDNPGGGPVTLDSIELVDAEGLTLFDGYLIPWVNNGIAGGQWVPPLAGDEGVRQVEFENWANRRLIGSNEATVKKGEEWQLALEVEPTSEGVGYSHGFAIYYHSDSGKRYVARSDTWVGVGTETRPCADWEPPDE
jgi:hypothetical protein